MFSMHGGAPDEAPVCHGPLPIHVQAGYSEAERRKDPYDVTLFPAYRKRGSNLYKSSLHASMLAWGPE